MLRHFLLGKIHRAIVTRADLDYVGSITLDPLLIRAAGFMENEKVDIYDVTNGARISTYVIPGISGSGEVGINGAAAHLVNAGDLVIIANYGWMSTEEGDVPWRTRPPAATPQPLNRLLPDAGRRRGSGWLFCRHHRAVFF